jgi:pimeloyl-ACP methyl ester carboxylesterase
VIVPDQRGDGYAPADLAGDALQLMDLLGIAEAALVGHSMGSFIARAVAAQAPERVERLILVGSAATARNPVTQDLLREVEALDDPIDEEFVRVFQASTIHRAVPAAFFEQIVAESLKLPARVWKAALSSLLAADPALDLARIRCPVLILGGDRDGVFSREEQEHLATRIPGAIVKISPEIGHNPQWEAPGDVALDLLAFLQSRNTR